MGLNGSPTNSNPYQLQPVYTHANTYFSLPLRYRWIGLFRGACALEITSCSYQAALGYPRVISIKLYGRGWKISVEMQIPSGRFQRNEWGWGNGRAANGVGPAPGENFGSGGENYRKTNPSVRYLYEVRENFNRVCVCRTRIVDSQARRMTHSTREFPRGPRLLDFSSHLGTNFSAFLFHACAQFEHVTRVRYRCFLARRTRTISLGRYPSSLITNWISRTRKSIVSRGFKWTTFRRWSNCACKFKEIFKSSNRFDLLSSPNLVWNFSRLWKCVHNFLKKICIAHE